MNAVRLLALLLVLTLPASYATAKTDATATFETWIAQRDAGVVRQERDFSCGLAALATVLTHYYRDPTSESELFEDLLRLREPESGRQDPSQVQASQALSFDELAKLGAVRGYAVLGVSMHLDDLVKLRRPVIVALDQTGDAHFTVLRAASSRGAFNLADPSWGNVWLGRPEFRTRFADNATSLRGRLLIIGPRESAAHGDGAALQTSDNSRQVNERYGQPTPRRALLAPAM